MARRRKILYRLVIRDLPPSLLAMWQRYNSQYALRPVRLSSYVRHHFTNYDALRREHRLSGDRLGRLKRTLNQQIKVAIDQWYVTYRQEA